MTQGSMVGGYVDTKCATLDARVRVRVCMLLCGFVRERGAEAMVLKQLSNTRSARGQDVHVRVVVVSVVVVVVIVVVVRVIDVAVVVVSVVVDTVMLVVV